MKKIMLIIAALLAGLVIVEAEAAPAFQAAGTAVSGIGLVNPAWPAHAVDDVALLFVESTGGQAATLSIPAGFAAVLNSPQATGSTTNGTRITVFWARATSTAMATPRVADPGDHVYARIITYRGVINTGNPWDVTGGGVKASSSSSVTVTGVTTTVPDTLIVQVVSRSNDRSDAEFSAETNANLTGIGERSDGGTASGNGGGFAVWDGVKATAGATGNTTATLSRSSINAFLTIALKPTLTLPHHIRIEHDGTASSCAPESITLKACANAACTTPHYTATDVTGINLSPTGAGYTWAPANPQTISAASGGINSGITLASSTSVTLAITGTPSPAPSTTYECYNTATATSGDCNLAYTGNLSFDVPNHTAGTRQVVTLTSCTANFASTTRSVKFWSTYVNPASGTLTGKIVAGGAGNVDCSTGYSSLGTSSASPTSLSLVFGTGTSPQATFSLCYPDVGQVKVDARYDGAAGNTPPDAGVVILGNDNFIAKPDHFTVSAIKCTTANADNCGAGALAMATPGDNPAAADATGGSFMRAGDSTQAAVRFTATVTARNALNATTPNYGLESVPDGVKLTPVLVAPIGGDPGVLTCKASTSTCVVPGGAANFSSGATTITDLAWDDVGIIQLMPKISDADYLGTGEVTTPTASGNIGRFFPDHFNIANDPASPILTRADLTQITATATGTTAPATVIDVDDTTGFQVNSKVRIPGAGGGGNAFTATVTAVTPLTLTLNTAIGTTLIGGETVISEWGTYMGEKFNAQFTLSAVNLGNATTQNYQGTFAKLSPATVGVLVFGAVNAGTNLTARLDTSTAPTGSFALGVADITAPLTITRGASADGPYTALQVGIAPMDSDGVKMPQPYDLSVAGSPDHASIMDATVQASTEVRYGRMKAANAYGSPLLALPIPLQVQYWNGAGWMANKNDSETTLAADSIIMSGYTGNLTPCETQLSPNGSVLFRAGQAPLLLTKPGANNNGSVTLTFNLGSTVNSSDKTCISAAESAATAANLPWFGANPVSRATFGIYKTPLIYRRESY